MKPLKCKCGRRASHQTVGPWSGQSIAGCYSCLQKYGMPVRPIIEAKRGKR